MFHNAGQTQWIWDWSCVREEQHQRRQVEKQETKELPGAITDLLPKYSKYIQI